MKMKIEKRENQKKTVLRVQVVLSQCDKPIPSLSQMDSISAAVAVVTSFLAIETLWL